MKNVGEPSFRATQSVAARKLSRRRPRGEVAGLPRAAALAFMSPMMTLFLWGR
jgi:hypothetical protein